MDDKKAVVVGCGLSGSVVARELAESGFKVLIIERRNHIGGNMYDYVDEHGVLVHKYGPHTFHTAKKELYDYICKFSSWTQYNLMCGAIINNKFTPTPFGFKTIDDYFDLETAKKIKNALLSEYPKKESITVFDALNSANKYIKLYASFLFENDYKPYCSKQWGLHPSKIDSTIFKRVPIRLNYQDGYFNDDYQVMPCKGYKAFFESLLSHPNITIQLNKDALSEIAVVENNIYFRGVLVDYPFVYTGPIDELFSHKFGILPYRSLKFELFHEDIDSFQCVPVVAYPQDSDFIRIIEYKKLTGQIINGTTYEKEYSMQYLFGENMDPYYPVITDESKKMYQKYLDLSHSINNLYVCGRLGDFKYYNMDKALEAALLIASKILKEH